MAACQVRCSYQAALPLLANNGPEEGGRCLPDRKWQGWDWRKPRISLMALHFKKSNSLPFSKAGISSEEETNNKEMNHT